MDTCYPIRKADGKDYDSLETLLNVLRHEPDGWWLASSNRQWHGGIHISRRSAPESVLTSINADKAVPLQCIASGNVVAWRINKNYCTAPYDKYQLRYSSTFLLVRSEHKPNPDDQSTWLTFYTLYMHLAPVSAYPVLMNCYRVKPNVNSLPTNEYNGREISGQKLPKAGNITLKENDLLVVSKQETFKVERETSNDVFGLAQRLKDGKVSEEKFWVSLQDKFVEQTAPRYHRMPEWMTKAVEQGKYDTVIIPEETFAINAGDAIGFLAEDNAPDKSDSNRVEVDFYSHIEVISVDTNMPGFLSNPKGIKTGRAFVKIKEGKPLYQRSGEGAETTFTPTNDMTKGMNAGRILPRDKTNQIEAQGTTWFQITADNWIKCEDVDELSQHDLSKLGFTALEEASTDDFGSLLKENFLKGIFDWVSQSIRGDTEFECQQGSETYKKLVKVIDQNNDGNLSQYELAAFERRIFEGLHSGENNAPELVRRLIVKHDSEWFGDSKHKHWQSFLNNDSYPKMMPYLKKWRDDMAWMSEVPEFKSGKPVWHFHPVEFIDMLNDDDMSLKWLKVPKGQLTFDVEGNDDEKSPWFSRIAHWPGSASGVTIGRGYDLGQQITANTDLTQTRIGEPLKTWLIESQGLSSSNAQNRLMSASRNIRTFQITRKQQYEIFMISYQRLENDVKKICQKEEAIRRYHPNSNATPEQAWNDIPEKIKELLVDLRYRGDYTPSTRVHLQHAAYSGDINTFGRILSNRAYWLNVPDDRFKKRVKYYES
ncbi:hypothetical protein [Dickeya dadantii]|uniref:hypothetical protein n=1 Tax=Dickeya dadantii TaxID=204038 RepID=UPI00039AB7A2|nr:hypothetical protein [Dickeya dadantii]